MNTETKICQNCKNQFTIETEDFDFYKRINVPPPTFCPECRNQRRMAWRNERSLYKRKCDAPGHTEDIISMYDPQKPYLAYDTKYWWTDGWDPLSYGSPYDFNTPFFVQYTRLMERVPHVALSVMNSANSDYSNFTDGNKNCYLVFGAGWNENVSYSNNVLNNKESQDLLATSRCQFSYDCVNCFDSYRLLWSSNSKNCTDSAFLYFCRNCSNCIGSSNLVNKSYCIFNKQYSKEEYAKKLKELNLGDRKGMEQVRERFEKEIYLNSVHRHANILASTDCTGDNINNSKNCKNCFDVYEGAENSKYLYSSLQLKDDYDGNGAYQNELSCELVDCNIGARNLAGITMYNSSDTRYCFNCHSSSSLFGCTGLRSKQYCILNKQYTKEEYKEMLPRVIEHMNSMPYVDAKGRAHRYGDFFPIAISPFGYNETIAQEYYNLDGVGAKENGYPWKENDHKDYLPTLRASEVPDAINQVADEITKQVIECEHKGSCRQQCTTAFRILPADLDFYRKLEISLPRLCPNCRHYERLAKRNPRRLWHRTCNCAGELSQNRSYRNTIAHSHGSIACTNEFETSYDPDRPEIVYCEKCYQAEVV